MVSFFGKPMSSVEAAAVEPATLAAVLEAAVEVEAEEPPQAVRARAAAATAEPLSISLLVIFMIVLLLILVRVMLRTFRRSLFVPLLYTPSPPLSIHNLSDFS